MLTLACIAQALGGKVSGREVLCPTPGHSARDRGTAIRLVDGAPDGVLVTCYNGGQAEALMVKDSLRAAGLLPGWDGKRRELTPAEREAIRHAEAEREREKLHAQANAAQIARQRLAEGHPANPGHPYLACKRIAPERLWQAGKWLLVPMQDDTGAIWNLQRIPPESGALKLYLKGGRTKGLFWWAGRIAERVVIAEGMGTAAAVRRATALPVIAAMTASNLPVVAEAVRARRPDLHITIAADDDPEGHKRAHEAAALAGADIAFPRGDNHDRDCIHPH